MKTIPKKVVFNFRASLELSKEVETYATANSLWNDDHTSYHKTKAIEGLFKKQIDEIARLQEDKVRLSDQVNKYGALLYDALAMRKRIYDKDGK